MVYRTLILAYADDINIYLIKLQYIKRIVTFFFQ